MYNQTMYVSLYWPPRPQLAKPGWPLGPLLSALTRPTAHSMQRKRHPSLGARRGARIGTSSFARLLFGCSVCCVFLCVFFRVFFRVFFFFGSLQYPGYLLFNIHIAKHKLSTDPRASHVYRRVRRSPQVWLVGVPRGVLG